MGRSQAGVVSWVPANAVKAVQGAAGMWSMGPRALFERAPGMDVGALDMAYKSPAVEESRLRRRLPDERSAA
ncbi:hypothetical protein ABTZ59_06890 [Streptomyces sp. NPDC094034]|uniref:hypothetical protein n=1 Tax=Streptomyces sp. NPDC094034 TaxID=3155309 RepID=UPI00332AE115